MSTTEKQKATKLLNLNESMIILTNSLENPVKNKEGFNYKYADLAPILDTIKPKLKELGLFITQTTKLGSIPTEFILVTVIANDAGESIVSEYPILKGTSQEMGAQITYARRYSICSLLNIAGEDDLDGARPQKGDDAHSHTSTEPVDEATIEAISDTMYPFKGRNAGKKLGELSMDDLQNTISFFTKDGPPKGKAKTLVDNCKILMNTFVDFRQPYQPEFGEDDVRM